MLWQKCFQPSSRGAAHTRENPPTLMVHQRPSHRPVLTPHFPQHFLSKSRRPYLRAYWLTWGLTETPEELLRHACTFLSISSANRPRVQFSSAFSSASRYGHTYRHTDSPEDLLRQPRTYWSMRVLSSAFPQRWRMAPDARRRFLFLSISDAHAYMS